MIRVISTIFLFMLSFVSGFSQYETKVQILDFDDAQMKRVIEMNTSSFLTDINKVFFDNKRPKKSEAISKDAMNSLLKLWEYSPFRCVDTDIVERIIKRPNGYYKIYNIAVHFSASDIKNQYRELVLIINERGIIDDIYIAIDIKDKEKLIKESSDLVDSKNRLALLDFLENINNAIKRKDLNFISNFFGDDTLLLSELHKAKAQKENLDFKTNIDPLKITKKAYLDNLKNSIKNEEFKDVIFRDIAIEKHPKFNHIYGISFVQSLPGSNFNHESYVFFIIDYYYDNQPKLCYRTCQPVFADNKLLKEEEKMKLNKIQFKE